jgi:hypothetical protein
MLSSAAHSHSGRSTPLDWCQLIARTDPVRTTTARTSTTGLAQVFRKQR